MASQSTITATAPIRRKPVPTAPETNAIDSTAKNAPIIAEQVEKKEKDFFWTYTEEPHRTRRMAIIKAHPEVTKLCGPEPLTGYLVLGVVALQCVCAYSMRNASFWSWQMWALAYIVGATANQNLFLAIHEISHNLAFRSPLANRLFAVFANLPIGLPYSASFRPYHLTHHKSLGVDGLDTDLPTALEAFVLDSILGKAFFCTFQIFFYAVRPMFVYRIDFTWVHAFNVLVQVVFDIALVKGTGGYTAWLYLLLSSFLAGSLHPLAGHFIAEHYVYEKVIPNNNITGSGDKKQQQAEAGYSLVNNEKVPVPETFSYYGPLNFLTYNVGYHNEHHDFPAVAWTRLPKLHALAKEFYEPLPRHESWVFVLYRFIMDESVGLACRVKRKEGGRLVGGAKATGPLKSSLTSNWSWQEVQA